MPEETSAPSGSASQRGFFVAAVATAAGAPWLLGGETVRTEFVLLAGAILTCALGWRVHRVASANGEALQGWRGARWPLVCGLIFILLLAIQALNPSHRVILENRLWRLEPLSPIAWAPKSLAAPFDAPLTDPLPYRSTLRYLLIFGTTWIYALGLSLGLTGLRDARRFVAALGVNGVLLAGFCIVHVATNSQLTLWRYYGTFDFSHSPVFFYKNHNGAYLAGSLAVVLGLAFGARSTRARFGWEIAALVVWVATVLVDSRVATACATLLAGAYFLADVIRRSGAQRWRRLALAGVALVAAVAVLFSLRDTSAMKRFAEALDDPFDFIQGGEFRVMLREVGYEMWTDRPVWGWGGGSFLYLFNNYHDRVPALAKLIYSQQPLLNRFYWPTANCDWVEFALEYGAVGLSLLAATVFVPAFSMCRRWKELDPRGFFLLGGLAVLVLHGFFDYVLRNPAIMILVATLVVLGLNLFGGKNSNEAFSRDGTNSGK